MRHVINDYLDTLLFQELREVHMPYRFVKQIQDDIRNRMLSCLFYWNDEKIRKTILFVSLEEALFYEPKYVQDDVREFVVTTIRNSMLEIAASNDYYLLKADQSLSNEQIKRITSEAIKYFDKIELCKLANESDYTELKENVYQVAKKKYPLAWDVLLELANMEMQSVQIKQERYDDTFRDMDISIDKNMKTVVCNGYTLEFDDTLKEVIGEVISGKVFCFYSDSFKMVSRNFEKILHILQIILEKEKVFCTSNYYISKNYLEKRKKILRAAHNTHDAIEKMNCKGAPEKIKECIDILTKG